MFCGIVKVFDVVSGAYYESSYQDNEWILDALPRQKPIRNPD